MTKLAVSGPEDSYEREANHIAEQVVTLPEHQETGRTQLSEDETSGGYSSANNASAARPQRMSDSASTSTDSFRGSGAPLSEATRSFFEPRFGYDFSHVRLHTDSGAAEAAQSVNARAFTLGNHIGFSHGEYAPETSEGRRLLAHELTHVVQQGQASDSAMAGDGASGYKARGESSEGGARSSDGVQVHQSAQPGSMIHRRPAELIDNFSFLGNTVGGGLNATLRDRLVDVEKDLKKTYDALGNDSADKTNFGGGTKTLKEWSGINSVRSWRQSKSNTSKHSSGSAVDVNYDLQPYIVTRSTVTEKGKGNEKGKETEVLGGEAAGASLTNERKAAAEVYDRAMHFTSNTETKADVSARKNKGTATEETTASVYKRFNRADQALSIYFRYAFLEEPTSVLRAPIKNIETASEADLLAAIPTTERRDETKAIGDIQAAVMDNADWKAAHPGWPYNARQQYFRILRDYEHVRIPMQRGDPSASPGNTRNPTRGFLHMRQEFVEAMTNVGKLRWGIADFGEATSGDVHHFDLGNHGGVVPDGSP